MSYLFFFSSRRRHTRSDRDWSSDVCSSDLGALLREIPADVAVSVDERLVPHLATRREVHIFPAGVDTSRWILGRVGEGAKTPPPGFTPYRREDGWLLLRRSD